MSLNALLLGLLSLAPAAGARSEAWPDETHFPPSTALAEGVSPEALARLDRLVQGLVDDGEVVGAELLVIKDGRSILHEAYGWRDREAEVPMQTGSVFCVRSMTKPLIGAAIAILVEEQRLELGTRVAELLPSFDVEGSRDITVEHLLTHTSGLPLSRILARDLSTLEGIQAVAELGAGVPLAFEPGAGFLYSDQGADTLTAILEVVSGAPAEDFVRQRLLEPLGMVDSTCTLPEGHPLRARACAKYAGSKGAWTRFWSPADPPLFPFFLGSQGLYATLEDYACFLDLWLHCGRAGRERILRPGSVRRTLEPGPFPVQGATGFPGLRLDYGRLMQLWTAPGEDEDDREVVVFGHTGSDGTHAWAFPEEKAMVLYFTQSRQNTSGLRVEELLGELFLGAPFDPNELAPPFDEYLGYYREDEDDLYRAIVRDGDDLALEIPGQAVVPLSYVGEDRWKLRPEPSTVLAFRRSEEGAVTGFSIGDHVEVRFEPGADLPSADELAARVASVHGVERMEAVGPLAITSRLEIERLELAGEVRSWLAWPDRWRVDETVGEERECTAFDGSTVLWASGSRAPVPVEEPRAQELRRDTLFVRFGDWRETYPRLRVIERLGAGDDQVFVLRTDDTSAPARTLYVDAATGRLGREDSMAVIPRMGRIGRRLTFRDFREVSGMLLPHRTEVELANPMIGPIVVTIEDVAVGVELDEHRFELRDE